MRALCCKFLKTFDCQSLWIHVWCCQRKWRRWDIVAKMWKNRWRKTNTTVLWQLTCCWVVRLQRCVELVLVAFLDICLVYQHPKICDWFFAVTILFEPKPCSYFWMLQCFSAVEHILYNFSKARYSLIISTSHLLVMIFYYEPTLF